MRVPNIDYCTTVSRSESTVQSVCREVDRFTFEGRDLGRCLVFQQDGSEVPQLSHTVDLCFRRGVDSVSVRFAVLDWADCTDFNSEDRPQAVKDAREALVNGTQISVRRCGEFARQPSEESSEIISSETSVSSETFENSVSELAVREVTGCAEAPFDGAFLALALLFARSR